MKDLIKKSILFVCLLWAYPSIAQTVSRDYSLVDAYVKTVGPLDSLSMGTIANTLTSPFSGKIYKARAIYYWIANNITYDVKSARTNSNRKNTPDEVLLYRQAVGIGFASLFQDMCSSADIRCLTVDGFVKYNTDQIGEHDTEINHSWAVVQLGQSPEDWYYVDPAFGSGYGDADMKEFTPRYSDAYFFTDKETFNLQHYPDNEAWKLGPAPKNKKSFFALPVVNVAAADFGVKKLSPDKGILNIKPGTKVNFSFTLKSTEAISTVKLGIGERRRYKEEEIRYTNSATTLSFTYKFEESSSYPLKVLVNGLELVTYYVDIE